MKLKFRKSGRLDYWLSGLFAINLAAIVLAGEDPRPREAVWAIAPALHFTSDYPDAWNKIIYDFNLASIVSLFFYWLIVRLPEERKRARIKRSFKNQYITFKEECIGIFLLLADGSYQGGLPEALFDQKVFRDYFKTQVGDGQDRWDRVANKLEGYYLQLLLNRMEGFREEFLFVLNNLDIENQEAFELAKNFSKMITSVSLLTPGYDNNSLLRFLWTVFTGWTGTGGYPDSDFIEDFIREI